LTFDTLSGSPLRKKKSPLDFVLRFPKPVRNPKTWSGLGRGSEQNHSWGTGNQTQSETHTFGGFFYFSTFNRHSKWREKKTFLSAVLWPSARPVAISGFHRGEIN
jgi:hypothetical protein